MRPYLLLGSMSSSQSSKLNTVRTTLCLATQDFEQDSVEYSAA